MQDVLLSLKNISKIYPGVLALDDVSLDIYKGETLALCGENGAGKSTLIKTLSGAIAPSSGKIVFQGKEYDRMSPQRSTALGISVIYQEFNLMNSLSVAENVYVGHLPKKHGLYDKAKTIQLAQEIFDSMDIDIDVAQPVGALSVAYMQLVEIAKSLTRHVELIVMDEPTAPLTNTEAEMLFRIIKKLQDRGTTIIYVSHRLPELFQLADRIAVMRDGKFISAHDVADTSKEDLIRRMVGREISNIFPKSDKKIGETVLKVENLCGNGVRDVNFELHKGEILGFAGLVGAGRTEIMRILFGADKRESGRVVLNGEEIATNSPKQAVKHGIVLLPEDRKNQGALLTLPIDQNVALPNLSILSKWGLLNKKKEKEVVNSQIQALKVACYSGAQLAGTLSGGNQQKVVLAKWLASNAQILIFDEPTRGIDVGAKQEIYMLMNQLCERGMSIIMISSEMEEIVGMSDRIIVLHEGEQMDTLEKEEFSQEAILTLASGEELKRA